MNQKKLLTGIRVAAAIAVVVAAIGMAFEFYYYVYRPLSGGPVIGVPPTNEASPAREPQPSKPTIKSDVVSLGLDTNYIGYFDEDEDCRKSVAKDGSAHQNSPCHVFLSFDIDGKAEKKLEVRRSDRDSKTVNGVGSTRWTGRVSPEQFKEIAATIENNEAFKVWSDQISITTRNVKITAKYADGSLKSPMSNIDERTTQFPDMVRAFRELERKIGWKRAN